MFKYHSYVYTKPGRKCIVFGKKITHLAKALHTAGRDGRDKFQVWYTSIPFMAETRLQVTGMEKPEPTQFQIAHLF